MWADFAILGKTFARAAGRWGRQTLKKGFSNMTSNVGFGFRALKANPGLMFGTETFGTMRGIGRMMRANPTATGIGAGLGFGARTMGRWAIGADLAGRGAMRGWAVGARMGAVGGGMIAADFLNPWGLGFEGNQRNMRM